MTENKPPQAPAGTPPSVPLIAAVAFLAISLVAAGLVISGVDLTALLPTPAPQTPAARQTSTPQATSASAASTPGAAQTGSNSPGIVIAITPPQGDSSDVQARLAEAIKNALETSPLAGQVQVKEGTDAAADLAVTWAAQGDQLNLTLTSPIRPALLSLKDRPLPTMLLTPGATPLFASSHGDMALPGGLMVALIELSHRQADRALQRIQALQALPSDLPPDQQAGDQAIILFAIAQAQVAQGNATAALDTSSQALRLRPDFPAAAFNRGSIYLVLGDSATALTAYETFKNSPDYQMVALYNQAIGHQAAGDQDAALEAAQELVKANPSAAWSLNLRGLIHAARGEQDAALADFTQADGLEPNTPTLLLNQGLTLMALKQAERALPVYQKLLTLDPRNPLAYYELGVAYRLADKPDDALHALSQAIDLNNQYVDAYLERARLEFQSKDYDKAVADSDQVLELAPDNGPAYQIKGDCLLAQEKWIEAEKAYTNAATNGVNEPALFAGRGWAHHRQREIEAAVADYQQAISLGDKDTTLLQRLGFALLDLNKKRDALNTLMGAVNGGLDTAESHAALALALDMNFREDEANQEYKRALALDPRFGDRKFLADQPLWTSLTIGRAMAIVRRIK